MKQLLTIGVAAAMAFCMSANTAPQVQVGTTSAPKPARMWDIASKFWPKTVNKKTGKAIRAYNSDKMVTEPEFFTNQGEYYGPLDAPDGTEWNYVADYVTNQQTQFYESAHITVYDSNGNVVGDFNADWQLDTEHGDVGVNFVQVAPCITQKFFNSDANHELMVYVHAVTEDYSGHNFMQVYSLETGAHIQTIEGLQVDAVNLATDPWSENFIMLFQNESIDYDAQKYMLNYDVYTRAGWGTGAKKVHTFDIDYDLFAGSGENALPLLLKAKNGKAYFALPHYKIPFFDPDIPWTEEPVVLPGNEFMVDLYQGEFSISRTNIEKIHTTNIPMFGNEGYLYTFPLMGGFFYQDDLDFNMFNAPAPDVMEDAPALIITYEKYQNHADDYVQDFVVYDLNGNEITRIASDVTSFREMMPIAGKETQICFMNEDYLTGEVVFSMVNLPSLTPQCEIPIVFGDNNITADIDRVPFGDSYKYVSSMYAADIDKNGNILHCIAWINNDGTLDRIDKVNLGKNIAVAQVNIDPSVLTPYIFDTDDDIEYMFLVKEYVNPGVSSASTEKLWVLNCEGEKILEFQPFEENGEKWVLNNIWTSRVGNSTNLIVVWMGQNWNYRMSYTSLPLDRFSGGSGTAADPFLLSTVGDFEQISSAPSASYRMVNDIDFRGAIFEGLGITFSGNLDGGGYSIKGLNLHGQGLFKYISGSSVIDNLKIVNPVFEPVGTAGLLAGEVSADDYGCPTISNVHVIGLTATGDVDDTVGGLVGNLSVAGTKIQGCSVEKAEVNLPEAAFGGIVGSVRAGANVNACFFSGDVKAAAVGGICQNGVGTASTITHCHVDANLTGKRWVGGILAESPARSAVSNCYVQGSLTATNSVDPCIGGIIGELGSVNDDRSNNAINNCVVALDAINAPAGAKSAHRIVGRTSDIDHAEDSTVPAETAIGPNYVVGDLAIIDTNYADDTNSLEGKTIALTDLNSGFMAEMGFVAGESAESPWRHSDGDHSKLWFESSVTDLTISAESLELKEGEEAQLNIVVTGAEADVIEYSVSDSEMIEVTEVSREGSTLVLNVKCLKEGVAQITASAGIYTVVCNITGVSGIAKVESDLAVIAFNGSEVIAAGAIEVYNVSGVKVAQGTDKVSVAHLAAGVYVVRNGAKTAKITIR